MFILNTGINNDSDGQYADFVTPNCKKSIGEKKLFLELSHTTF